MIPFFSIIIPVYNVERFIGACIESVLNQEMTDYEIILVNDGSTDQSYQICREKAAHNTKCILVSQENQGLSAARNSGIEHSCGKYLIFLDGDDMLAEHALETCRQILIEENYPEILVNRAQYIDIEGKPIKYSSDFAPRINQLRICEQYKVCYLDGEIQPWACAYVCMGTYIKKKKLYFQRNLLHEDELWTPQAFLNCQSVKFNHGILFLYRQGRDGSISQHLTLKNVIAKLRVIRSLENLFQGDKEKKALLMVRSAMIYWGILDSIVRYGIDYSDVEEELYIRSEVLLKSRKFKYQFVYFTIRIIGISRMLKLLKKVNGHNEKV